MNFRAALRSLLSDIIVRAIGCSAGRNLPREAGAGANALLVGGGEGGNPMLFTQDKPCARHLRVREQQLPPSVVEW